MKSYKERYEEQKETWDRECFNPMFDGSEAIEE